MSIFSQGKILAHIERVAEWKKSNNVFPVQIELGTTNLCNNKCPFCCGYKDREEHAEKLDSKVVYRLLEEAASCGVRSITFTGDGEPTCHKDWLEFIKYTDKLGMDVGLITNGCKDFSEAVPYCQWIRVSVDAATPETYYKQHGVKAFEKVLDNLETAIEKKEGSESKCTIGVGFLTCKDSNHEIIEFAKLMSNYQVNYVQYRPLLSVFGSDWFSDDHETIATIHEAKRHNRKVVFSEAKYKGLTEGHYGQTTKCYGWIFEAAISADGGIYRCCHYKGIKSQKLGDISKGFVNEWMRIKKNAFRVLPTCPKFCRHYSNNRPMEEVMSPKEHPNFI